MSILVPFKKVLATSSSDILITISVTAEDANDLAKFRKNLMGLFSQIWELNTLDQTVLQAHLIPTLGLLQKEILKLTNNLFHTRLLAWCVFRKSHF